MAGAAAIWAVTMMTNDDHREFDEVQHRAHTSPMFETHVFSRFSRVWTASYGEAFSSHNTTRDRIVDLEICHVTTASASRDQRRCISRSDHFSIGN